MLKLLTSIASILRLLTNFTYILKFIQNFIRKQPNARWNDLMIKTMYTYDTLKEIRNVLNADRVSIFVLHNGGNKPQLHTQLYRSSLMEVCESFVTKSTKEVMQRKPLDEQGLIQKFRLMDKKTLDVERSDLSFESLLLWEDYGIENQRLYELLYKDEFYIYLAVDNPSSEQDMTKYISDIRRKLR